jgi:hypothetical protein
LHLAGDRVGVDLAVIIALFGRAVTTVKPFVTNFTLLLTAGLEGNRCQRELLVADPPFDRQAAMKSAAASAWPDVDRSKSSLLKRDPASPETGLVIAWFTSTNTAPVERATSATSTL